MKKLVLAAFAAVMVLAVTACAPTEKLNVTVKTEAPSMAPTTEAAATAEATTAPAPTAPTETQTAEQTPKATATKAATATKTAAAVDKQKLFKAAKEYLLNPTDEGMTAWSERFIDQINMDSEYTAYLKEIESVQDVVELRDETDANDPAEFAKFIDNRAALNKTVPKNWKKLFEADFHEVYDDKIVKYEDLGDNTYQVYVKIDGKTVPYVTVNSINGYFHG